MTTAAPAPTRESKRAKHTTQPDPPGELPADLKAQGWKLEEHVGPDKDRFMCAQGSIVTSAYLLPQDAIAAARKIQSRQDKRAAKDGPATTAMAEIDEDDLKPGPNAARARTFNQFLRGKLTAPELEVKCDELQLKREARHEMDRAYTDVKKQFSSDLGALDAQIATLTETICKRFIEHDVACEELFDYDQKRVFIVRLDTGAVTSQRAMTPSELQPKLMQL